MKIGLVCPYSIAKGGGVQEVVRALQSGLNSLGHKAYIITPRPRDADMKRMKGVIFLGTSTDIRSPLHTTSQFSVGVDGDEIEAVLEKEKFDILHFHEPWVPMLSKQILSRSQSVNIATFHAKLPETLMTRTLAKVVTPYTKSVLKYLHEFTAVSEAATEFLHTMTDAEVSIIPNGIDLQHFHAPRRREHDGNKQIVYVGRLEKRKGVNYLIKAFAELSAKRPNVKLTIAGDGTDCQKLELLVKELGLKNVEFLGYVSDAHKKQLLKEADLFCSPAIYGESFGIVLLEAMATGLVTVAGNNPGYADVLRDLGSLSLVNPKDTERFAARLDLLLHEPDLRKLWRSWAKKTVTQYDYAQVVRQYESFYRQALKKHG